jgi:ketosteroid isomerase-like protein
MKNVISLFSLMLALCACLAADDVSPVVRAEREFSTAAGQKGVRAAFLEFLADNSVVFEKEPVPGKKAYEARPESSGILYWLPSLSEISAGGDFGYSTGPWQWQNKKEEEPVAYGQFVSVWRKQQDASWKVEVDLGCNHAKPARPVSSLEEAAMPARPAGKTKNPMDPNQEEATLLQADREFAAAASGDVAAAYRSFLLPDARVLRNGMEPTEDPAAVAAMLANQPHAWEPLAAGVASSGDLGYTYGAAHSAAQKGHYLRVWKRGDGDRWKVALEVIASK